MHGEQQVKSGGVRREEEDARMPLLIAPVFNSVAVDALSIDVREPFQLVSGSDRLYDLCFRFLRNSMNENKLRFEDRVQPNSLFIYAQYPEMKVTSEDRQFIEEIENYLNISSKAGVCSIPYVLIIDNPLYSISYLKRSFDGPKYEFTQEARDLFERVLTQNGRFPPVAYRRHMLSLEKESLEDQLLDLWIALESLFVPDGTKGEITFKVRFRMAYYFGESFEERKQIVDFIKSSYSHRSEIVHSGKQLGAELKEEVAMLKQLVSSALVNMYMEGISVQELRGRLDELILSGECYTQRFGPKFFEKITFR